MIHLFHSPLVGSSSSLVHLDINFLIEVGRHSQPYVDNATRFYHPSLQQA